MADGQARFSLAGKTVLVTGATGILGRHFCRGLAAAGASLALIDLEQSALDVLAQEMIEAGASKSRGYACDLTREDAVSRAVAQVIADFGRIDVLHNNAASKGSNLDEFFKPFEEFSLETWREIMNVNVDGMFLMAKHVGRHMVEKSVKGSIIQTASIYGVVAPDQRIYEGSRYLERQISSPAVYSASKAAVVGLTKFLASYWGAKGIRVNTLTPGGVESGQNETFKTRYSNRVPLGRMAHADEMIGALVFLASDASSYVTGQNIVVDGGLTAW